MASLSIMALEIFSRSTPHWTHGMAVSPTDSETESNIFLPQGIFVTHDALNDNWGVCTTRKVIIEIAVGTPWAGLETAGTCARSHAVVVEEFQINLRQIPSM